MSNVTWEDMTDCTNKLLGEESEKCLDALLCSLRDNEPEIKFQLTFSRHPMEWRNIRNYDN